MKRFWYKFVVHECPLCGRGSSFKERIYNRPKPKKKEDRYDYKQVWDYCDL